jgi:adenylate kinase
MTASARLLIVGPQGSGKGTQGVRVAEALGIPVVSTGDIFRANIKEGTDLGKKVTAILDAGDLVPDELTSEIVRDPVGGRDPLRLRPLAGALRPDDQEAGGAVRGSRHRRSPS